MLIKTETLDSFNCKYHNPKVHLTHSALRVLTIAIAYIEDAEARKLVLPSS